MPRHDLFTYRVPAALVGRVSPGMRVRVPLGRQTRTGVVAGFAGSAPPGELRSIIDLLDPTPFLPADLLDLCRWTAAYYLVSLAEVIGTIVPARVPDRPGEPGLRLTRRLDAGEEAALARRAPARARAYRTLLGSPAATLTARAARTAGLAPAAVRALIATGIAERTVCVVSHRPAAPVAAAARHVLTPAQQLAVDRLETARRAGEHAVFLLHGVTGSGKTEVFLGAAERVLAADRDVLILVPEIALTHHISERVRARFGDAVAVLHSGLAPRERWEEWRRIAERRARIVIGARSAVFAPLARLGLVVVDEEHDGSYKQEEGIRYNARDLAVVRARLAGAIAVLASATPSVESYSAAQTGRHVLLELPERPTSHSLPAVEIVDLRGVPAGDRPQLLSPALHAALEANLAAGGQALVFLNRRGYATYLQCPACGTVASCPQCSVSLTWHRASRALMCHHCSHHRAAPDACPACGGPALEAYGVGTEQIEDGLRACFPLAAVDRLDRDAAHRPAAQRRILRDWHAGTTDILVGTQMVSKGHDVPGVTLVGVLLADLSLNVPDFRAAERTFQLLVQVAGRAGRGASAGRVIVQTLRPAHPSLTTAAAHDYGTFVAEELARRRALGYPPFARLIAIRLDGRDRDGVERAAQDLAELMRRQARQLGLGEETVLGPAPPPVERARGRHRRQILLRSADVPSLRRLARGARGAERRLVGAKVRLAIDVDPYSM